MTTRFKSALIRFQSVEKPDLRGRRFVKVNLLLQRLMRTRNVSEAQVVGWFGVPDLFQKADEFATYVYWFDHVKPSKRRDEWYLYFRNGILVQSGLNRAGINDLSHFHQGRCYVHKATTEYRN